MRTLVACATAISLATPITVAAQGSASTYPYARAVAAGIPLIAAPGYERLATDRIATAEPGWTVDRVGNLVRRVGQGSPRRVIACGIDETGYVVSAIDDDGYLRVHMDGNGRHVPLWDQFHEGQRVVVAPVDRSNPSNAHYLPGVFAVRSNHLWRKRAADNAPTSIENLWL